MRSSVVLRSLLAFTALCASVHAQDQPGSSSASAANASLDAFAGRWHAVRAVRSGAVHSEEFYDFEFIRRDDALLFKDHSRFVMVGEPAPVRVSTDGEAYAEWRQIMQVSRSIRARAVDGGKSLAATVRTRGFMDEEGKVELRLMRSSPATSAYLAPKLGADGRRARSYAYKVPERVAGGWPVATPESVGLDRASLVALANEILREGDLVSDRHTEGVLVLRHGKLVFRSTSGGCDRSSRTSSRRTPRASRRCSPASQSRPASSASMRK